MSKRKSSTDSGMKASSVCRNKEDILAGEVIPDNDSAVVLFLAGQSKGECYLRSTLEGAFTVKEEAPVRDLRPDRETYRVYKLPLSGIWITGKTAKLLVCSSHIFFQEKSHEEVLLGSLNHSSSRMYNVREKVYDFEPLFPEEGKNTEKCGVEEQETDKQKSYRENYEKGLLLQEIENRIATRASERKEEELNIRIERFTEEHFADEGDDRIKEVINSIHSLIDNGLYGQFRNNPHIYTNQREQQKFDRNTLKITRDFLLNEFGTPYKPIPAELMDKYYDIVAEREILEENTLYYSIAHILEIPDLEEYFLHKVEEFRESYMKKLDTVDKLKFALDYFY